MQHDVIWFDEADKYAELKFVGGPQDTELVVEECLSYYGVRPGAAPINLTRIPEGTNAR